MKTITPTEQDLILASKLNIVKNPSSRFRLLLPLRWPLTVIGIFLLGVSIYLEKYTCYELTGSIIKLIGYIFFSFGAFGLLALFLTKIIPKRIWKKNKILHAPYTLTWDHNTLFMHSDHCDSRTDWSSNCQMVQDENYILAYYLQNCFYIIPKRYFENNEEMQDFLNHLENGIKKNKENTQ